MKFSIDKEQFLTSVGIAVRGASTRSAIQTLAGVMVRAENGSVELQATDMELGVRVGVKVEPEREGAAVVPGRLLLDVVRSLPKEEVSLESRSSEGDVELVSGPPRFHLRPLPADEFPRLPEIGDATVMTLPAPAFVATVNRVARAASRDETRPHLTGVLVSAGEKQLRMVATDSYRLSVKETVLSEPLDRTREASEARRVPFNGEPLEIGFNPDFFREGLESAESDELLLKLISPLRPGLIESVAEGEGDGGSFIYLVMPIRLNV